MNKNFQTLELDKILTLLAEETSNDDAADLALSLTPADSISQAELLLTQTEDAFSFFARYGAPSFSSIKNVNNSLRRAAAGGSLTMKELLDIAYTLRSIRALDDWHSHCGGTRSSLDFFFDGITVNKYLETRILNAVISEEEMSDKASDELFDIRRKIKAKSNSIREKLDSMIHSPHYAKLLQEPIVTQRTGRFVVPVKAECRGDVPGLVHDTSSSGATVFIEPASVVEANNSIKVLQGQEHDEIQRILYELSAEAGDFADSIKSSYDNAVRLNLIFAKANLAYKMKASKPILNTDGIIDLKNARHPLLDKNKAVPVNIKLGEQYDTLVITGPNTGGKTVSLKTLGLLTLMAMCGLLIPVSDMSHIAVFDNVLADIGDEQSIAQSLSTFSSHIVNIVNIIKQAGSNSLVLIDELGAGTDPIEGAALAVAIIEQLRSQGARIAATTHYAELKAYALETEGVINGSCEFDVDTLQPTYRLMIGVPGRSNAFAISEHLGMPQSIVNEAKSMIASDNRRFENVLDNLEKSRRNLEDELNKAKEAAARAAETEKRAQAEKNEIENLRRQELEKAKTEASHMIDAAKRKSSDFLLKLEMLQKEQDKYSAAEIARKTRREIKNRLGELDDIINPCEQINDWDASYVLEREPIPGDSVLIRGIGQGEVLEVSSKILVQSGMMKTRVARNDIRLIGKKKKVKHQIGGTVRRTTSRADSDVKTELDLRGQTVDEALGNLGLFIDKCVLNNISEIRIIHGKGTGALRSAVTEELRHHPNIEQYRLGVYGEGEDGVTIAKLK